MKSVALLFSFLLAVSLHAEHIKIGAIFPMTGNMAQWTEAIMPGIKLFEMELEEGNYKHTYEVILEDDQLAARLSAQAAQKLINIDKVNLLLSTSSSTGNVVAPLASRKNIPSACMASDTTIAKNYKHSFVHWIKPYPESVAWVALLKKMGIKKVALILIRQQGVVALAEEIEPLLKQEGIELTSMTYVNPTDRDFRMQLSRIRDENPDAIMPLAFSPTLEIIINQSKQVGLNVPMPNIEVYDFISDPNLVNGEYYISGSLGTPEFRQRLLEKTGKRSAYCLPFTYNILNLYREACETMDEFDPDKVIEYISNLNNHPSAIGPITTDPDRFIDSTPALFQMIDGEAVQLELDQVQ